MKTEKHGCEISGNMECNDFGRTGTISMWLPEWNIESINKGKIKNTTFIHINLRKVL
jgi:hypothetical protein